jgi:hypothetical protein
MKIFQIWVNFGKRFPSPEALEAMRKNLTQADQYVLIAEENFLDVADFRQYEKLESEALKDFRIASMFKRKNAWNSLDIFRTWFLWKHPDFIYVDADAELIKPLDNGNRPAFAEFAEGIGDGFIIQGNNCSEFFNDMLSRMYAKHPDQCFPQIANIPQNEIEIIPKIFFRHLNEHSPS